MVFGNGRLIDENCYAGSISWPYGGARDFKTLLKLLMAYAERKAALEAYWKHNPDLILLDGPLARALRLLHSPKPAEERIHIVNS
jgi:hypothetical protein